MKTFLILLSITLLASCSVMDKAGIVKRRYRPGFYFSPITAQQKLQRQSLNNSCDKLVNDKSKPEPISIHSTLIKDTNDLAIIKSPVPSGSVKKTLLALVCPIKENTNTTPLLKLLPAKVNNVLSPRNSLMEVKANRSLKWGGDGCGEGCSNLMFTFLVALAAIGIWALFPAISPEGAQLLAYLIVILIMLIILLISRDLRDNRRQDMHHFHH